MLAPAEGEAAALVQADGARVAYRNHEAEGDAPAGSKARGASKYKVAPAPPLHQAEVARDEAEWRVAEQGSSSADQ